MSVTVLPVLITMSRDEVREFVPGTRDGVISISSPGAPQAELRLGWSAVLRLVFDDLPWLQQLPPGSTQISEGQADEIARWMSANGGLLKRIVVHCDAGVSRSVSVAWALSLAWHQTDLRPSWPPPNMPVFASVLRACVRLGM